MNLKKLLFCALFCATSALAQFDNLRGPAYNPYGTLGAAPTIADLIAKPSDIYGHKFIYVAPIDYTGYSAFDLAGGSTFLGFGNSLILGYAKNSWGLALDLTLNKWWFSSGERYSFDVQETLDGDNIGLNVSFAFKDFTVYGSTRWLTHRNAENYGDNTMSRGSAKNVRLGVVGGNKLIWDIALDFARREIDTYGLIYETNDILGAVNNDILNTIRMKFNLGYKALQNDKARLIVGLNNTFTWNLIEQDFYYYSFNDDFELEAEQDFYELRLNISPNILGEVAFTKHLFAFIGACYDIYLLDLNGYVQSVQNGYAYSYIGLRYEREGWAVETRLRNVFEEGYDEKNPFINLGGFIYF